MLVSKLSSAPCTPRVSSVAGTVPCSQRTGSNVRYLKQFHRASAVVQNAEAEVAAVVRPVHPVLPALTEAHFEASNTVFVEEFRIRGNEAGPDQRANIITIANLLQEVGGNHGVAMWGRSSTGFASMPGMDHLIFVATRMQIRMEAYPMWGDIVRLETYFAEDGRLTTRRDWRLTDVATGRHLGAATSTWVTINTETRRPAKIPEGVKQRFRRLAPSPPRFAIAADQARKKLPEFVFPPQLTAPSQLGRRSDMDPNGHINNVAYLAWALEVIPEHICQDYQLMEVEMDFKAECTAGEQVDCFGMPLTEAAGGNGCRQQFLHLLRKGGTDTDVWRARTSWMPLDSSRSGSVAAAAAVAAGVVEGASNGARSTSTAAASQGAAGPHSNGRQAAAVTAPLGSSSSSSNGNSSSQADAGSISGSSDSNGRVEGTGGVLGALAALFGLSAGSDAERKS